MGLEFERNITKSSNLVILQKLEAFQPEIIHVDEPERLFLGLFKAPGVEFAKHNQIPCVGFFHTDFISYIEDYFVFSRGATILFKWISKRVISKVFNLYNSTLVASTTAYKQTLAMGINNVIFGNFLGVSLDQFNSSLKSEQFFTKTYNNPEIDQKLKLVFLGRLTPDKGWNFTIDAFSEIAKNNNNLDSLAIIVAGDGSLRDKIDEKLTQLGLNVYLLSRVPPEIVPALLINSDIHVTTSEKETTGLTILEAFAAGIPVIAPRAGGVIDTVQEGQNGFLFAPKNIEDFAQKLQRLIDNPDLRHSMGIQGRNYAIQHDWNTAVDNLLNAWQAQIDLQH
jgi:glycosyltransferase involved in cell wall biosynthesis